MHHVKNALITWSDRGAAGPVPSYHGRRPDSDPGPILRLLTRWPTCPSYDAVWVLTNPSGEARARTLCKQLQSHIGQAICCVLPIEDPTDHGQLFQALSPLIQRIDRRHSLDRWQRDVLLSAGTPQMQTMWVILVQSGLLRARMLQVIPDAFVPDPHPSPVREVRLDIEGFPEIRALRDEVRRLRAEVSWNGREIVAQSASMQTLQARAQRVAASDLPVLVLGETGSGKELLARAIHEASERSAGPFVAENCASLSEGLLASELFGHEAGAFTGATGRKRGVFELAHGGSLFLDEVGDMPLAVQAHLLRVLQEGQIRRVGGESTVRVDVRLITATHRDLRVLVRDGRFREDLFYRLNGTTLELPPLRERSGDIPLLVDHFLRRVPPARKLELRPSVLKVLGSYPWPGNVRELRAEVMRWKVFCQERVELDDLSPEILSPSEPGSVAQLAEPAANAQQTTLAEAVRAAERCAIEQTLRAQQGNVSRSAIVLGIDRHTLKRKVEALRIDRKVGHGAQGVKEADAVELDRGKR
jgi:DNA-binding NtrC family response regulator